MNGTRHLVRTGQEGGKDACRIFRLRPPQRTRKRVGGKDLGVKAVRDLSLPPARPERLKTAAADERHQVSGARLHVGCGAYPGFVCCLS